jgi:hypothetical protein
VVLPPLSERRREPPQEAPPRTTGTRTGLSRDEERYARRESAPRRARDEERPVRRDRRESNAPPPPEFAGFVPTGNTLLDDYLNQLDSEPDNFGLALAIGRLCAQTERHAIMALAFKRLIKAGQGVEQLTEELEGLIEGTSDPEVKQQLYRLLGDAYSKQGRYRDAMNAYAVTFGQ